MLTFIIPYEPVAWKAPIIKFFRGFHHAHDIRAGHKNLVKKYIEENVKETLPESPAYEVSFIYHMPIPKSLTKKLTQSYLNQPHRHTKKPDCDNLNKLYIDCFKGLLIQDDSAVSIRSAIKIYSADPKTVVFISPANLILSQEELNHYKIEGLYYDVAI